MSEEETILKGPYAVLQQNTSNPYQYLVWYDELETLTEADLMVDRMVDSLDLPNAQKDIVLVIGNVE